MGNRNTRAKFSATWKASASLPPARKALVRKKLCELAKRGAASSRGRVGDMAEDLMKGVKVIRPGEPGYEAAKRDEANRPEWEWDLAAANELDKAYTAVTDEAKKVADVVEDAVSSATWLLLAVAAVMLARK